MLFLEGTASDYMHTTVHSVIAGDRTWSKYCELLRQRFGTRDPDAEF